MQGDGAVGLTQGKPVERQSLTDQVVRHLTQLVAEGTWPAGSMLPSEPELARGLGVSRTVVREAVRVLLSRGMLTVQQGRGTAVVNAEHWELGEPLARAAQADRSGMRHWLEIRQALEVASATLAAERADAEDRERISQALQHLMKVVGSGQAYAEADLAFHLAIAKASHNPQLERLLGPLLPSLRELREQLERHSLDTRSREPSNREHAAITKAILAGDVAAAAAAMAAHQRSVATEVSLVEAAAIRVDPAEDSAE